MSKRIGKSLTATLTFSGAFVAAKLLKVLRGVALFLTRNKSTKMVAGFDRETKH